LGHPFFCRLAFFAAPLLDRNDEALAADEATICGPVRRGVGCKTLNAQKDGELAVQWTFTVGTLVLIPDLNRSFLTIAISAAEEVGVVAAVERAELDPAQETVPFWAKGCFAKGMGQVLGMTAGACKHINNLAVVAVIAKSVLELRFASFEQPDGGRLLCVSAHFTFDFCCHLI
jgi:hypothetical protein